jgi:hypothetical protein
MTQKIPNVFSKIFLDSIGNPKIPYSVLTLIITVSYCTVHPVFFLRLDFVKGLC